MANKNVLDLLMGLDEGKIKRPTKEIEIKRLSDLAGDKVIFTVGALSQDKFDEIQDMSMDITGKDVDVDVSEMQLFTVIEGMIEPNIKDKALMTKYKTHTPKELIHKLLLPGEVSKLYNIISELSGFGESSVEEIKN